MMKIVLSQLVCERLRKCMENEKDRYSWTCHVFLACSLHISASTTVGLLAFVLFLFHLYPFFSVVGGSTSVAFGSVANPFNFIEHPKRCR